MKKQKFSGQGLCWMLRLMVGVFGAFLVEYFEGWGEETSCDKEKR